MRQARINKLRGMAEAVADVLVIGEEASSAIRPRFPNFRAASQAAFEVVDLFPGARKLEMPRRVTAPYFATLVFEVSEGADDRDGERRHVVWNRQGEVIGTIGNIAPRLSVDDELDFRPLDGDDCSAGFFDRRDLSQVMNAE